jgi:hypothetical protein
MKKLIVLLVALMLMVSFSLSIAGPGRVLIEGDKLIFRDGSGNEYVQSPATTITPATVTISTGGGSPVTTTGTETLTNKTLTSPVLTTPVITEGTNAQIYISNGTLMLEQTVSGDATITNAGVVSLEAGTDAQMFIYNATEAWGPKTISGDITITNAGVASVGANKIGLAEMNVTNVNVPIVASATSGTATVTSGAINIGGAYAFANVDAEVANITSISGTTLTVTLNAAAAGDSVIFRVSILEP